MPVDDHVPASQLTTVASDVDVQAAVTRWPGPAVEQAEHIGFTSPLVEKKEPLVHTHAVKTEFGAELALQDVQEFVCEPKTEYVPAAQLTTTVSDVEVQGVVTRWPGPAVEQAEHVGFGSAPV